MTDAAEKYIDIMFQAFSDRTRLRIMNVLMTGDLCVCDIVYSLDVPESSVSRNLMYLNRAGLVSARRDGQWLHYRLTKSSRKFHKTLIDCLRSFQKVPQLARDVEKLTRTKCSTDDIQTQKI